MRNNNSENPKELSLKDKISFIQNYQRTFKNWESNYQNRVIEFINQYEDNSENIFIENEIENAENVLLQLDQALKDNYTEKDSIDLLDTNPMRDLYIDLRIESTIKSKSTYKKIKAFLEQRKIELKQPQQIENSEPDEVKTKKRRKTLLEFINNIDDKEAFLNDLKNTFPTEIGLSIKAIVLRLVEVKILIYGTKEFKNFHEELTKYFDRSIGTYGSINDYIPEGKIIDTINKKLNPLIDTHKSK